MMNLADIARWLAGGNTPYRTLFHCMRNDNLWVVITVVLDLAVATGYSLIALHWWRNEQRLGECQAKRALGNMKNIFVFCGICGYLFIPVKMFWPAWRLYDMFMVVLAFYTWRYAWDARGLKVVYNELGRSAKLAEDLQVSRREAERKNFFLNAISHDLRTPLNGLVLQTSLAEMSAQANDAEGLRDALTEIKMSVHAAARLLDEFLELGRLDWTDSVGLIEPTRIDEVVSQVAARFQVFADTKGIALRSEVPSALTTATDRIKLERILANLLNNAIKYTHEGEVCIAVTATEQAVSIAVVDTGEGIAPEHLGRLFEEFYQVHNRERDRAKGFGLGLAIARRLANQISGEITVDSTLGRGSRFTVTLPVAVPHGGRRAGRAAVRLGAEPSSAPLS